ncbi:MAG: hypothetical protein M3487_00590, partial [Actinomycetota bacterium]|nr:hypothetical protein [Actinomycetota bacterium]
MTRRLVAAILVTVLVTLLVVGASTLVITRWQARATTERELVRQAESLAAASAVTELDAVGPRAQDAFRQLLVGVREALRADGIEFVVLADGQRLVGRLPDGIESADLDVVALDAGRTVSGHDGSLVFAAAPRLGARATVVAVVTREATVGLAGMNRWFVVAAVFTLALGVAVATFVGSRLARP